MVRKTDATLLILVIALFLVNFNFVSAEMSNCWAYSGTNNATCVASGGEECIWRTQAQDSFCMMAGGCCMEKNCGLYTGTNESACVNDTLDYGTSCKWDPWMTMWFNGTQSQGGCVMDWETNDQGWGGVSSGCWSYDGNKATCSAQGGTCKWTANDQNQDPMCYIKNLADAKNKNSNATITDIGCCQNVGCWNYDNNETLCKSALQGNCFYNNNSFGSGGWCNAKSCSEIVTQANCTYAKQSLMMPCNWNNDTTKCEGMGGGGFSFFNNTDSCFSAGGWYNSTGGCVMPSGNFGGGSGGFMFGGEAHCWFADNKPTVCGNITGCAYCVVGTGVNGVSNSSADNICKDKGVGFCEGHNTQDVNTYSNANNSANLVCTDIKVNSACNFGPLPNCKWTNSSVSVGVYCEMGAKTGQKSAPPAQYCEDPISKNNYTICMQLSNDYMMPCKWQNTTYPFTNCTFNNNAVFGGSGGEMDFGVINSQFSCTSAGGTWQTEYYVDDSILKQDSWCEMTGFFDIDQGQGQGNKANCDTSCWACEFQSEGAAWANVSVAEAACVGSALGKCSWTNDNSSFNKLGRCDFPKEMEDGGAKDCSVECEGCNFMSNSQTACEGSMANNGTGCKWVNDPNNLAKGGFCVDKTKKTCSSDCFSCYDFASCVDNTTALDCNWDQTFNLCKAKGFTGEVCFNGVDDDSDNLIDCSDPDCGFDNFCGGSSFGGNCFAQTTEGSCNSTTAFGSDKCVWINDTWNPIGWCDMPGANCWKFNDNLATCGLTAGCTNQSSSMGTNAWCEMNMTSMNSASCWSANNETACAGLVGDCAWKNNTWQGAGSFAGSGWCEYAPMGVCMNLGNSTSCNTNSNCTWRADNYSMTGGWCDTVCMNPNLNQASCENVTLNGLCQWKNMSATCQPSTFMMMGMPGGSGGAGGGGMSGCGQYGGNQTGCLANNITCSYKNDSFAMNNRSATEPSGWCMEKAEFANFGSMEGNVIQLSTDSGNVNGGAELGVDGVVDIIGNGMRISNEGLNFGAGIYNISKSMMCNGNMIGGGMSGEGMQTMPVLGSGAETTKFYWYLDTDGNLANGCVAVGVGANYTGFDFMINYVSRNSSSGIVETKQLMRCSNGTWNPTNAEVTTSKKMSCGEISGVMIAVSKDIESFSEYNKTAVMRIFMTSANETMSRTNPSDSVGPGYYTPGTVDFGFVDCSNPSNANNAKCKNFQKFGFNVFEECKNGIDDDENGLVDCDDPLCSFMPSCNNGVGFSFVLNANDKVAPVVMFSEVEELADSAFLKVDTNEPSNLTLQFYKNDSTCTSINVSVNDIGSGYQTNANFKPFHSIDLIQDNLGYALVNSTAYYYKIKVCDPSNNCGVSACSNFTTKASTSDKSFIFKIELPEGYTIDIPALNKTGYNFTETFGGVAYEVGIKTNTSVTKNINFTIHCEDMAIGFFGVNIIDPTKIDLSNAFVCNTTSNLMGMNSSLKKWNKLIGDLRLGGAADYIEITMPVAYSVGNTLNWTDDAGAGGQNVSGYVSCSGNSTQTVCRVPVSMGFSAYTISVPASNSPASADSSGGAGGGGSGGGVAGMAYSVTDEQFKAGYTKELAKSDRISFKVNNETHRVAMIMVTNTSAEINVSSTPQIKTLSIGEEWKVDVDANNYYDLLVKLNSINNSKANITIKSINEITIVAQTPTEDVSVTDLANTMPPAGNVEKTMSLATKIILVIVSVIVLVVLIIGIIFLRRYLYQKSFERRIRYASKNDK